MNSPLLSLAFKAGAAWTLTVMVVLDAEQQASSLPVSKAGAITGQRIPIRLLAQEQALSVKLATAFEAAPSGAFRLNLVVTGTAPTKKKCSGPMPHLDDTVSPPGGKSRNFRWVVIGLGFIITLINYLDRSAISYSITPIKQEFGLDDAEFGFVAGAFGVGYMLMVFVGGILVDKAGAHRMWALSALVWSGVTCMMGMASSFTLLFLFRTALGLAEGPHFPSMTRVVADWLPAHERGRATALGLAAVPMASVIGAPLITHLIGAVGWKMMFTFLGSLGIVWAFVWYLIFKDYPENCKFVSDQELRYIRRGQSVSRTASAAEMRQRDRAQGTTTWRFMLFNPSLMTNNFAFFSFGYLLFFAITWLPGYLEKTYNLQLKEVGAFLIAPWLTAAVLLAAAGYLSDWLYQKTGSIRISRSHMIWICQLLSALCFVPILFKTSLNVAIVSISLGVGFGLMPNAAFYTLNCDLAKDRAATSLGIMDMSLALAGILAPVLTGQLAKATGGFNAAFGLLIFFTLTSVAAILLFQRPDRDVLLSTPRRN